MGPQYFHHLKSDYLLNYFHGKIKNTYLHDFLNYKAEIEESSTYSFSSPSAKDNTTAVAYQEQSSSSSLFSSSPFLSQYQHQQELEPSSTASPFSSSPFFSTISSATMQEENLLQSAKKTKAKEEKRRKK